MEIAPRSTMKLAPGGPKNVRSLNRNLTQSKKSSAPHRLHQRERLIKHDAVIQFFNEALAIAQKKNWLSGEHFSVDGTLIQAWAGNKSFVRKGDGDKDDNNDGGNFKGRKRSNETHESKTDPDAKLYRKGKTASELRYMGHTLSDNHHGLVVSAMVTNADGHAEREAAKVMLNDTRQVTEDPGVGIIVSGAAEILSLQRGRGCQGPIAGPMNFAFSLRGRLENGISREEQIEMITHFDLLFRLAKG